MSMVKIVSEKLRMPPQDLLEVPVWLVGTLTFSTISEKKHQHFHQTHARKVVSSVLCDIYGSTSKQYKEANIPLD